MQYIMEVHLFLIVACALVLAIGCYLLSIAVSKAIKVNLFTIDQKAGDESERKRLMERFIEFFEFHSQAKQLSILQKV